MLAGLRYAYIVTLYLCQLNCQCVSPLPSQKGNFYFVWTALVSLCLLYNTFTIPLRFAFDIYNTSLGWLVGDYLLADLVYLLDLLLIQPHLNFLYDGTKVRVLACVILCGYIVYAAQTKGTV